MERANLTARGVAMKAIALGTLGALIGYALYASVMLPLADMSERGYREQMAVHCLPGVTQLSNPEVCER